MRTAFLVIASSVGIFAASAHALNFSTPPMLIQTQHCEHETNKSLCPGGKHKGAGGFTPIFTFVDDDLLKKVQRFEPDLKNRSFSFDNSGIIMLGGMGYHTNDAGVRVGGGAWIGYKQFDSDEFQHTDTI